MRSVDQESQLHMSDITPPLAPYFPKVYFYCSIITLLSTYTWHQTHPVLIPVHAQVSQMPSSFFPAIQLTQREQTWFWLLVWLCAPRWAWLPEQLRDIIDIHIKGKGYKTNSGQLHVPLATDFSQPSRMWMQDEMQPQAVQNLNFRYIMWMVEKEQRKPFKTIQAELKG